MRMALMISWVQPQRPPVQQLGMVPTGQPRPPPWSVCRNYTVGDHDGDGDVDFFRPLEGAPDGSDSTQTGSVEMYAFNSNGGVNTSSSTSFNPHTSPRAMVFADMDGDGLSEQIIAAGEATPGLFIGAWHTLEWDLEGDSVIEMEMSGFASSSSPLSESDQGLLITNINTELTGATVNYDAYDTRGDSCLQSLEAWVQVPSHNLHSICRIRPPSWLKPIQPTAICRTY